MTTQNKRSNSIGSYIVVLILGGALSHYFVTPAMDGKFDDFLSKHFGKKKKTTISKDQKLFNQIDHKVVAYRQFLFRKYYKNATSKYREYYRNNRANQLNPETDAYWQSRGYSERPGNWQQIIDKEINNTQADWDNHSNQLNPNNDAYWQSRGYDERPDDWDNGTSNGSGAGSSNADMNNHSNQMNPNNSAYQSSRGGKK